MSALLLQGEGDQQEDAPSLGLFAAKLYLYLGELKFAKLDVCAPVLGASRPLTSCTCTPPGGGIPSALRAARGPWPALGSGSLSSGPSLLAGKGAPCVSWHASLCTAGSMHAGHRSGTPTLPCAGDTGFQQGHSLPAADWDCQAAFPDAGMQQAPTDTGCCWPLQASWQRCCVCQTPSLRPGAGQGLRQRSCPTVRMPRTWQPSSCPWTAACRAWCSPPCSCRGGTGVPSRWGCSRQSAPGAD